MIKNQDEFEAYIKQNGIGSNDKVADSVKSYISYLNSISKYLGIEICPENLNSIIDVDCLSSRLSKLGKISKKTISNYGSAMRQYVNMVQECKAFSSNTFNLGSMKEIELLRLYGEILKELKNRNIVRTQNSPVGDYTEWLVSNALSLKLAENSKSGYDAVDVDGTKYQIKGRRTTLGNNSRQLSAIRKYDEKDFDQLAAVIFDENFNILVAVLIPHDVIGEYASFQRHTNAHNLIVNDRVVDDPRVVCFRDKL